jgi:hypothetical protein
MNPNIPKSMQAALLEVVGRALTAGLVPASRPCPGQAMVHIATSPINPSGLGFLTKLVGMQPLELCGIDFVITSRRAVLHRSGEVLPS